MLRTQPPVRPSLSPGALLAASVATGQDALRTLHELLLREYDADDVLLASSGTHALQLAISAAVTSRGAQRIVALPAFSCFDVATAAIAASTRVLLYDVDPNTLAPELASFERTLRLGARVAVVAPLYGVPVAWQTIEEVAQRFDALLIEDAAQGSGARWRQKPLGSIGPISVLSFGRGKGWTGGGGGALLWRGEGCDIRMSDASLAESSLLGRVRGVASATAQWLLGRPSLYGIPAALPWLGLGQTIYREPTEARAMNVSEAAMLLASRKQALREAGLRRERGAALRARLADVTRNIAVPADSVAGYLRFPARIDGLAAASVVNALRKLGGASSYPKTLAELPAVRAVLIEESQWPGAVALSRELFTLPTHSFIRAAEHDRIVAYLQGSNNRLD